MYLTAEIPCTRPMMMTRNSGIPRTKLHQPSTKSQAPRLEIVDAVDAVDAVDVGIVDGEREYDEDSGRGGRGYS